MVVAILAVLKAGCQYVPLDGGVVTDEGLAHIIQDTKSPFVLCLERFAERVFRMSSKDTKVLVIDQLATHLCVGNTNRPSTSVTPRDGAYVIYTSGKF
jgi:non-ribosomal peptide synthetase component F